MQDQLDDGNDGLDDGRKEGDWTSRYPKNVWLQVFAELAYLLCLLGVCLFVVWFSGFGTDSTNYFILSSNPELLSGLLSICAGTCGGCIFALKWHYHVVAKSMWHRDRLVWRLTSPILSGVLAFFTTAMIKQEFVPFLKGKGLEELNSLISVSFFLGLFSDNLLAALQNFANKTMGTLRDSSDDE